MYKVLITTTAFTSGGCCTSSVVAEFESKEQAEDAVRKAPENSNVKKNITVSAVLLNPYL